MNIEEEKDKGEEEKQLTTVRNLLDSNYITKSNIKKGLEDNDIFLLFFFDQFSMPCRKFLPLLIEFYKVK